jgi:hypothetical protein
MHYNYAIEFFDPDSAGSQWETFIAECPRYAIEQLKQYRPFAKVNAVFVEHDSSSKYYEEQ